jgi:hypothetical protein
MAGERSRMMNRTKLRQYLGGMMWSEVLRRIDNDELPMPLWGVAPSDPKALWDVHMVDKALDLAHGGAGPSIDDQVKMLDRALGFR